MDNHKRNRWVIVVSHYNEDITSELLLGAQTTLIEQGIAQSQIDVVKVPGAVEIPLAAQWAARKVDTAVVITLGAVIRGDSDHYDFVAQQVSDGCQRVALDHNLPVIFGVLTTHNRQQALDRIGGASGHYGKEAALSALRMVHLSREQSVSKVSFDVVGQE